jgi:hypothetical protein
MIVFGTNFGIGPKPVPKTGNLQAIASGITMLLLPIAPW